MDFSPKLSTASFLEKILTDYPYGQAVLLELLQNADDAEATRVTAIFESFTANEDHPAARSPALLFHNSSTFTERDLANILCFGSSEETWKRHDATKVGRFGIGFNSTFHVSDVVAFVTGDKLIAIDPSSNNLPPLKCGNRTGGSVWHIPSVGTNEEYTEEQKEFANRLLDVFEQSGLEFNRNKMYQGTIFRLPLRTASSPTSFWAEVHHPRDVAQLLVHFFDTASLGMVMLKHIVRIEACIHRRGPKNPLELLFSVNANSKREVQSLKPWLKAYTDAIAQVRSETRNLGKVDGNQQNRTNVRLNNIKLLPPPKTILNSITVAFQKTSLFSPYHTVVTQQYDTDMSFQAALDGTVPNAEPETEAVITYQLAHHLGPGASIGWKNSKVWEIASTKAQNRHAVDVPWGAVIVNVKPTQQNDGKLLCFFPLKSGTQLPVHIHGCFNVSSDRQSIKDVDDEWNKALASEVIPYAYLHVLTAAQQNANADYYRLFPTLNYTDTLVKHIASESVKLILQTGSCISGSDGEWKKSKKVKYPFLYKREFFQPTEDHAVAVHCLLVAAAKAHRGQHTLATFPGFDVNKPPTLAQLNQLEAVAKLFEADPLTPDDVRQLLKNIPVDAASLFLTNFSLAMELFLICTKGVPAQQITSCPNYYVNLPAIPLFNAPNNFAFVESVPTQLKRAKTSATPDFAFSPFAPDSTKIGNQCLVCKSSASLDLALEAFPQKVVVTKTVDKSNSELIKLTDFYINDPKYQKLLGIHDISVRDLAYKLEQVSSQGSFEWRNQREGKNSKPAWKLENDETKLSISAAHVNRFIREASKKDAGLAQLATIPFLPIRSYEAKTEKHSTVRASTSLIDPTRQSNVKCFRTISDEDHRLSEYLYREGFGVEIDFSVMEPSAVESIGQYATLDGVGTLSLFKLNAKEEQRPISEELARLLVAHFCRFIPKIKENAEAVEILSTLPIFKVFGHGLCVANQIMLLPCDLCEIPNQTTAPILELFAGPNTRSILGFTMLHCDEEASVRLLERVFNTNRMNTSDFWASAVLLCPEAVSSAEPGSLGHTLFEALIKSLGHSDVLIPNVRQKLRKRPLFGDKWGRIPQGIAVINNANQKELVEAMLESLMSVKDMSRKLPRIVTLPSGKWSETQIAKIARNLDIKTQFDEDSLAVMANALYQWMTQHKKIEHSYARALFDIINGVAKMSKISKVVVDDLRKIRFIPTLGAEGLLKFHAGENLPGALATPDQCVAKKVFETHPLKFKRCVHPLVISDEQTDLFLDTFILFKWTTSATASELWNALEAACKDCTNRCASSPKGVRPPAFDPYYIGRLYKEIEGTLPQYPPPQNVNFYFAKLDAVGTSKNMSTASQVRELGLSPLFIYVDKSLKETLPNVFKLMQIRDFNDVEDIVASLKNIPRLFSPSAQKITNLTLDDKSRDMLCNTLIYLATVLRRLGQTLDDSLYQQLLVPTTDGKCNFAHEVFYEHSDARSAQDCSHTILSNRISSDDAKLFKIRHRGLHTLMDHNYLVRNPTGCASILASEIKKNLVEYNDPSSVIIELLKIADTKRAKSIEFLMDVSAYSTDGDPETFFGAGMKEQLGPALVVKMDAELTLDDLTAFIYNRTTPQNVVQNDCPSAGFRSVFYITDCPSIVTSERLLIFDPTLTNIDVATPEQPGVMFNHVVNKNVLRQYQLQFTPLDKFGVEFGTSYRGTLFRFPLRKRDNLSKMVEVHEVLEWFKSFKLVGTDVLLFLKSLQKIQISQVNDSAFTEIFSASINNLDEMRIYRQSVSHMYLNATANNYISLTLRTEGAIQGKCEMNCSVNGETTVIHHHLCTIIVRNDRQNNIYSNPTRPEVMPVTIAIRVDPETKTPIPKIDGSFHSHMFPLKDCDVKLPFHVNANFSSNKTGKQYSVGKWWESGTWNDQLMTVAIPRCVMECMKKVGGGWDLWPLQYPKLLEQLLKQATQTDVPIFPLFHQTHSAFTSYRDCSVFTRSSVLSNPEAYALISLMKTTDTRLVAVNDTVYEALKKLDTNSDNSKKLSSSLVVKIIKKVMGTQTCVPFSFIFDTQGCDTLAQKWSMICDFRKYLMKKFTPRAPEYGFPLNLVRTGDLAVIDPITNPCYHLSSPDYQELFNVLCPHLGEQNIIYHSDPPQCCRVFSTSTLLEELPKIAFIKGYEFLIENTGNDVPWQGGSSSLAGRWLEAFWQLVSREGSVSLTPRLHNYPLIPVCNMQGRLLRSIGKKDTITNGFSGPGVLSQLISMLNIENIDPTFSEHEIIVSKLSIKSVSIPAIIKRAAQHIEVFSEFTNDERDSLRRIMLAEPTELPEEDFRKLPLFKVFEGPSYYHPQGRVIRTNIVGVVSSVPQRAPRTMICNGLAVEEVFQESPSNRMGYSFSRPKKKFVTTLSNQEFRDEHFFKRLGTMSLHDEMENWRFIAQCSDNNCTTRSSTKLTVPITERLPTILSKFPRGSLAAQVLRYLFLNEISNAFEHPNLSKYQGFAFNLSMNSVSVSNRKSEYIMPLVDICTEKPINRFLHKLHLCLCSVSSDNNENLVNPLPLPLANDLEVREVIRSYIQPVSQEEVLNKIISRYIDIMKNPKDDWDRELLVRYFTGYRSIMDYPAALEAISVAAVLEFHARKDACFDTYLGLPVYSCEPFDDDVTEDLKKSISLNGFSTLSVMHKPFFGAKTGMSSVSKCAHYSKRWLCWTQIQLLHPILNGISGSREVETEDVIEHIQYIVSNSSNFHPNVLATSLEKCYDYLSSKPLHCIPLDKPLCALPPDVNGKIQLIPLDSIYCFDSINSHCHLKVSLVPYFYTIDDFKGCGSLLALIRKAIPAAALPGPTKVLNALTQSSQTPQENRCSNFNAQHEYLIRVLLSSCDHNEEVFVDLSEIPIPHFKSEDMLCARDACAPDDEGMLQKVLPTAKITSLPLDLCRRLNLSSMTVRFTESLLSYTDLPPLNAETSNYPSEQIAQLHSAVDRFNAFLPSDLFAHVIGRVIATNEYKRGVIPILSHAAASIKEYRIVPVSDLKTHLADNQFPEESLIAQSDDDNHVAVLGVSHMVKKLIYLNLPAIANSGIPMHVVIGKEINKILGSYLVDIAPLIAVLENAHKSINFDTLLDYFGCLTSRRDEEEN